MGRGALRSATVLVQAVTSGANPINIKRGIDKTCAFLVERLKENAVPVSGRNDIRSVASISAGNDNAIGEMIADALDKVTFFPHLRLFFSRVDACISEDVLRSDANGIALHYQRRHWEPSGRLHLPDGGAMGLFHRILDLSPGRFCMLRSSQRFP